jgi:hypothetical protein
MDKNFKKTILIEREWLSRLIDLGKEVSKNKMVKISNINYLLFKIRKNLQ